MDRGLKRPILFKRSKSTAHTDSDCAICGKRIERHWDLCYFAAKQSAHPDERICLTCAEDDGLSPIQVNRLTHGAAEGYYDD